MCKFLYMHTSEEDDLLKLSVWICTRYWSNFYWQDLNLIFQKSGHKRQSSAAVWPKDIVKLTHQLEQLTKTRPPISWPRYCQVDLGNFNVEYVLAILRRKRFFQKTYIHRVYKEIIQLFIKIIEMLLTINNIFTRLYHFFVWYVFTCTSLICIYIQKCKFWY